jgi:hypothetical protein
MNFSSELANDKKLKEFEGAKHFYQKRRALYHALEIMIRQIA